MTWQRICYFCDHLVQDVLKPAQHMDDWDLVAVIKEIQLLHGNGAHDSVGCMCPCCFPARCLTPCRTA